MVKPMGDGPAGTPMDRRSKRGATKMEGKTDNGHFGILADRR